MVKNVKEALNKQGNILMSTKKKNMNMNTLLNLGGLGLGFMVFNTTFNNISVYRGQSYWWRKPDESGEKH